MAENNLGNLMPREVALQAENAGVIKANLDWRSTLMLAMLAGAFIGFGAVFSTTVMTGNGLDGAIKLPFGLMRLIGGAVFCLGLILVTIAGAEMFTGNVLLVMAAASRKITAARLFRNWGIVFAGNFLGGTVTAILVFLSGQYRFMDGQVGVTALQIAERKTSLGFGEALMLAFFCNILVCLAIWLSLAGRTVIDKVAVILFPISAFVTSGFEHSVANMYFISSALLIKYGASPEFWQAAVSDPGQFAHLTPAGFLLGNLLPVTLGNILGGLTVGLMYWSIYCHPNIMTTGRSGELLRQLTQDGRRRQRRLAARGTAELHHAGRHFSGHLRNLTTHGAMAEFYEATGLPAAGDSIRMAIHLDALAADIAEREGVIVNSNRQKNLMGRAYLVFNIEFTPPLSGQDAELLERLPRN